MKPEFDLIIVTADEPYNGLSHTQILFANYLSKSTDLIFIEAPEPWQPIKLFKRLKLKHLSTQQPTVIPYLNFLPAVLPLGRKINEYLLNRFIAKTLRRFKKKNVLIWHFDAYRSELRTDSFPAQVSITHLYHVIDPFYINPIDEVLSESAAQILVTSPHIAEHYKAHAHKLKLLPQCVDLVDCEQLLRLPLSISVPNPTFFVLLGTISDDIDFELLQKVADMVPLVIAGKVVKMRRKQGQYQDLLQHSNTHYAGLLKPEEFYPLLEAATAGIICYDINIRNLPFSPLKAINYLIADLPVISNCRTELEALIGSAVFEFDNNADYLACCKQVLEGQLKVDEKKRKAFLETISLEKAVGSILADLRKN